MGIDLSGYKEAIDGALANGTPCVVATASARGEPNISLRGSMMVFDADHLAYWDRVHGRQQEQDGTWSWEDAVDQHHGQQRNH